PSHKAPSPAATSHSTGTGSTPTPKLADARRRDPARSIGGCSLFVLLVHDEVIKYPHHRHDGRVCRLLVDRHACRAVPVVDPEDAARPLGKCRVSEGHCNQQRARSRKRAKFLLHFRLPPFAIARPPGPSWLGS